MSSMSLVQLALSHRRRVALIVTVFFLLAGYYVWTAQHDTVPASPPPPVIGQPYNVGSDDGKDNKENHENGDKVALETLTSTPTPTPTPSTTPSPTSSPPTIPTVSADTILMSEYDGTALSDLCKKTSWKTATDIVIHCNGRVGGVGNVRQEVLVCVRQAIEIGAALIRPSIMLRSDGIIEYQHGPVHNMSYMFDLEKFDARLHAACPDLPLYESFEELEKLIGRPLERIARPWDLPEIDGKQMTPKEWAEANVKGENRVTVIDMPLIMRQRPVCSDKVDFVTHFGGLLEFRPDTQRLAAHAISEMEKRFKFSQKSPYGPIENAYIGIHLRTEVDAVSVGYTSYEEQAAAYIGFINSTSLRAVYAASGNTTSLELFAKEAATLSPPATIVTKWDLLKGEDVDLLKSLTWDQEALVDYLILEKSSKFAGVSESSFSWGLAYARQVFGDKKPCTGNSSEELYDEDGVVYLDSISEIYGRPKDWHVDKLWY